MGWTDPSRALMIAPARLRCWSSPAASSICLATRSRRRLERLAPSSSPSPVGSFCQLTGNALYLCATHCIIQNPRCT